MSGIASLSIGTVLGFSAILIPQLVAEGILDSDKSTDSSWIGTFQFTFHSISILDGFY